MRSILAPDQLGPTVCAGEILVEIVATTVGNGFMEAQPLVGPFASGAPAIFISQCGRLGGSAAMIGAVGTDDFGRVNLEGSRAMASISRQYPSTRIIRQAAPSFATARTVPATSSIISRRQRLLALAGAKASAISSTVPDTCM